MDGPFVLVEGLDVILFASLDVLTGWVEAQDVRDGVYEVFDATGQEVILAAESDMSPVTASSGEPAADRLRARLTRHLNSVGTERVEFGDVDLATVSLAWMIRRLGGLQQGDRSPRG